MKKILLIEPFFTGSHQLWAEGWRQFSIHDIQILSLSGKHWKWRMHGGAVTLAQQFLKRDVQPDWIVATDMLDVATFLGLTKHRTNQIPVAVYFHENQITYPWSATDPDVSLNRDNQYGFKNFTTALAADKIFFNSAYHQRSFLDALPAFLKQFPDYRGINLIPNIRKKSKVLSLGVNLRQFDEHQQISNSKIPLLLWNHRWEYDKNPDTFFETLFRLKKEGYLFQLAVLGEKYQRTPAIFEKAKRVLAEEMVQFGKAAKFADYAKWLWNADILPVTNNQDFFGQSVVEAIYCNCYPILPHRLAYPEHIPKEKANQHLYNTDEDFYFLLKKALENFPNNKNIQTQSFVEHYDWRTLAPIYDATFA
ncbi:MAG: DUF3524 domain-containing protein [Bacteroidota bacterium]